MHLAAAHQHHRRDAQIHVRHEHRSFRERKIEVLGRDREISRVELLPRIQRHSVQAFDRRHPILVRDAPVAVGAAAHDVELPRRDARRVPVIGEDFQDQAVAAARWRAGERRAVALLHDDASRTWRKLERRERKRSAAVGRIGDERQKGRDVRTLDDGLELMHKRRDLIGLRRLRSLRTGARAAR